MKNKTKIAILTVLLVVSLGLTVYFGVSLVPEIHTDRQGAEFYAAMPVEVLPRVLPPTPAPVAVIEPEEIYEPEPEIYEPEPFIDFDALREDFPSIVGWIQSAGTPINYPIVQGTDNDFYLHRLPDRTRHAWGSIFLDYRNAADFSDAAILIYGHNMRSGDMFGSLKYYARQDFFEAHPIMFIFSPGQDFVLHLFAGYEIEFEVPPMSFDGEDDFYNFIADIRARSVFQSDVTVSFGDTLVFLCTCTDSANVNDRLIIVGVLAEFCFR